MYIPPVFREDDSETLRAMIAESRLASLVTATSEGLLATPLPLFLDPTEGEQGTLYGHLARANPQWRASVLGDAMVIFAGPDAYVSPSWYASKREHGKVVPTWNYAAIHAYGRAEFFDGADRLLEVVTRLTELQEAPRSEPWSLSDAPAEFVKAQLKGIVGLRLPIRRLEGKRKMSQNRPREDRLGVISGLSESDRDTDRAVAALISRE